MVIFSWRTLPQVTSPRKNITDEQKLAMGAAVTAMLIQKSKTHGNAHAGFSHVWMLGAIITLISILIFAAVKFKSTNKQTGISQEALNFD